MWFFPFFGVFMEFHILNGQGTVCRHVLCSVFLVSFSVLVDIIHASRVNQKQFGRRTICLVGSCCMRGFSLDNTELRGGTLTVPCPCTHSSTHVMGQVQVHTACVRQTHLQAAPVSAQCLFHAPHFENELCTYCNFCLCYCLTPGKWRMFLFHASHGLYVHRQLHSLTQGSCPWCYVVTQKSCGTLCWGANISLCTQIRASSVNLTLFFLTVRFFFVIFGRCFMSYLSTNNVHFVFFNLHCAPNPGLVNAHNSRDLREWRLNVYSKGMELASSPFTPLAWMK